MEDKTLLIGNPDWRESGRMQYAQRRLDSVDGKGSNFREGAKGDRQRGSLSNVKSES